jgi:large subunit ribosomal protein LP2
MKYLSAYLLCQLGGNETPTAKDIKKVLSSVGIETEDAKLDSLISSLAGKNMTEVIAEGNSKLASVPSGGGAAPAAASGSAPAAAEAVKEEEAEESVCYPLFLIVFKGSDDDMGMGLFD